MIKNILNNFGSTFYVQIWEDRIKAVNISSKETYDQKALVAVKTKNGKEFIEAVGNNAFSITSPDTVVTKPFSNEKPLVFDAALAEKLLQHIFRDLLKGKGAIIRPRVVIHPMLQINGELESTEIKDFKSLAVKAGARDVKLYQGKELSISNFNFDSVQEFEEINR